MLLLLKAFDSVWIYYFCHRALGRWITNSCNGDCHILHFPIFYAKAERSVTRKCWPTLKHR